jgi:hypothetical protein
VLKIYSRQSAGLRHFDGVAETIAYGQHDRVQLRMADEYLVELA